jgi:hypothetical protein
MAWGLRVALALVVPIFLSLASYGEEALSRTFNNVNHGFSISFPDGWTKAPPEALEAANQFAQVQLPGAYRPLLQYAYWMTNQAGLEFPPYVVIRVAEKPSSRNDILRDMEQDNAPQGVRYQRGRPRFDAELHACLNDMHAESAGKQVDCSVAYFLTKESVIKLFFYFPRQNEQNLAALAQRIIKNVRISDDIRIPPEPPPLRGGLVIAIAAVVVIILVLTRPKAAKAC